jgi:hypothetical protein
VDNCFRSPAVRSGWTVPIWGAGGWRLLAGDLAVVVFFVMATVVLFHWSGAGKEAPHTVSVEVAGTRVFSLDLERDRIEQAVGPLGPTWIEIRNRRVRILDSPCPLKLGIRAGWIDQAGEMLICLPNEVVVTISGSPESGMDAVAH